MKPNRGVPIVNNAGMAVTFEIQTPGNPCRGSITLQRDETHYVPGVPLTYETLVLRDSSGKFTDQSITMDELADGRLERVEVTPDFKLVRHRRKTWTQKCSELLPRFKPRSEGGTLPR